MLGRWNIDSMYLGIDTEEFILDLKAAEKLAADIISFSNRDLKDSDNIIEKLKRWIDINEKFSIIYNKLYSYVSFRSSIDVRDKKVSDKVVELEGILGSLSPANTLFSEFIRDNGNVLILCKNHSELKNYEFYFQKILEKSKYRLSPVEEKIMSVMSITGSKAWERLQSIISSEFVEKAQLLDDKKLKREQYLVELNRYSSYETISSFALNSLKGEVISSCKLRKYKSVLDKTLIECHMDKEILSSMMESIEEYLPRLREYYKIKAEVMGYSNGLPYYERETPIFSNTSTYSFEKARDLILESFSTFSSKMYEYAKAVFDNNWIDYISTAGKKTGATCDGIYAIKESRIRMNYRGTLSDVNVLAHELGHGYHNFNLFNEKILNYSYDLPIAETASKFSECIFKNSLRKIMDDEEKIYLNDFILSGFINTILDIQSRFYFEDMFFEVRNQRELDADEIKDLMIKAQKKSYGDALDEELLHPYMWMNKPHYYFPERNYYNFPYTFGALLSIGMYQKYEENPKKFLKNYDLFLQSTGREYVYNLCKILDIDVKSKLFWENSLDYISNLLEEFREQIFKNCKSDNVSLV